LQQPTKPRAGTRRSVEGKPGIYVRADVRGRTRFEFTYRDTAGKQRWQTVEGGVTAAVHARQDILAKMRRGQRVISSRISFAELATHWLRQKSNLRQSSHRCYERALQKHVLPSIGRLRISHITTDDIALLVIALQQKGLAGSTITNVLVPMNGAFNFGVRGGLLATNPVRGLERDERPQILREEMRIIDRDEINALLRSAPVQYRTLLATAIFTGLRAGELLGLRWSHLDLARGVIRVRDQIDRTGIRHPLKTDKGRRDVVLQPALATLLREHRRNSSHPRDGDHIFTRRDGRPMHPDVVRRCGLQRAASIAGLDSPGKPRLRLHDLRHGYASLLVAQGTDITYVSRQLGHASITTTLNTYTHLFDQARNAEAVKQRLEDEFGDVLAGTQRSVVTPPERGGA